MPDKRYSLIEKRKQLGLTQQAMAEQLGISQNAYCCIENGAVNPSIENYHKMGKVLGINAFVLMNRINEDLNIYDKSEPLKVMQISFRHDGGRDCINTLLIEDSSGTQKDLSIDEFSNILYYRYINGYRLNIDYQAHDCEEEHKTNKRQALIKRRKALGLTQQDMAEQLEMSYTTYWGFENGKRNISLDNCIKIGKVLGIKDGVKDMRLFVLLSRSDNDLNMYDKNEQLKLIWIFIRNSSSTGMLRVEDSHGEWKDLTLDEFSNTLYFRVMQGYDLNTTYDAKGSEKLNFLYVPNKSESFQSWCESQGEFGKNIIENAQLPHGISLADFLKGSQRKIKIHCTRHGVHEHKIANITNYKCGCPKCTASGTSYPEQFIYWSLKQLYPKCENRHKIEDLEVDVFIPENNTCIEYNGYTWHESKEYMDLQKRNHIKSLGYNFITINEHKEKIDTTLNGDEIDTYYDYRNKNEWLKGLVMLILKEILHDERSSLIDFKAVEENAWEYSKGKIAYEDSVAYLFPKLTEEWDSSNYIKPEDITSGSGEYIVWKCKNCGHTWRTAINSRARSKSGCPICGWNTFTDKIKYCKRNSIIPYEKSIACLFQELIQEWGKSNVIKPEDVTPCSSQRITWKCTNCRNEWTTGIKTRTYSKTGCPICGYNIFTGKINPHSKNKDKILYEDSVANKFPCLVTEWDSSNTIKPEDTSYGSGKYIVWRCKHCGNKWTTMICDRTRSKTGCTSCGYNIFTDKINPHSINQKKEPIAVVNGVEIYI